MLWFLLNCFLLYKAPLNTLVKEDKFAILTETGRIPVPILPGEICTQATGSKVGVTMKQVLFKNTLSRSWEDRCIGAF